MHLLNATSYELQSFEGSKIPPYAILSHRWGADEIKLQDVKQIQHGVGDGYEKIRKTCAMADAHGLEYVWVDTCCIDKTSSAELSEAINSMYRWYQESVLCYAYLDDVSSDDFDRKTQAVGPEFKKSKWFTRGWTLQELIAPSMMIFFDENWQEIGTKLSLQSSLSTITGIPGRVLQGNDDDLRSASIAQRMSWASQRETTRIEDLAYCLMGIFGVNMPMLYGEGDRAFARLQEEIMKVSDDHSLFAWESSAGQGSLLAPFPAAFSKSSNIIPTTSSDISSGAINVNNKGIHLDLFVMDIDRPSSHQVLLTILPCEVEGNLQIGVGIYVRATSETKEQFIRTKCDKIELVHLSDSDKFEYRKEKQCIVRWQRTTKYQSSLAKVIENGRETTAKLLLEKGAVPNQEVLQAAARCGHEAAVKLLLDNGADPNGGLWKAVETGHETIVKLLLDRGADPNKGLWIAVEAGHEAIVKLLLEKGAVPNQEVLQVAAKGGHEAVVRLLLDKGADPEEGLCIAVEAGHEAVVKLLLEKGAVPNQEVLRVAAKGGREAVVKLLLDKGAHPNLGLWKAVEAGHEAVVKLLLDKGANPNNYRGLANAAEVGHEAIVKLLLDRGADPSLGLWKAAEAGHEAVVKLLLEKGAISNHQLLPVAVKGGHEAVVKLLLDKGADPNEGLWKAAETGHEAIVKLLLDKGADPDRGLRRAAEAGHEAVVKLLVDRGDDPNVGLADAALAGHEAVVKLLLDKGANPNIGLAGVAAYGHEAIVKLLLDKGADPGEGLWEAVEAGHEAIVKLLLDKGSDPNEGLLEAVETGHEAIVKLLLDRGADPEEGLKTTVKNKVIWTLLLEKAAEQV